MMRAVRRDLPSGTFTFLFSDIEGSTKLLHELGAEAYADALLEHRRVLREAFARHGGIEVGTEGDSFFVAFPTAHGALKAAQEAQEALASGPIRVRMGLHTGTAHLAEGDYVGEDVHMGGRRPTP
jgi:class 3 adenylate cyclase